MEDQLNLTHHFLIAMPGLADPHFFQTIVYICEHNNEGAMGLVLNRPTSFKLGELFEQISLKCNNPETNNRLLLAGGPIQQDHGFVLHRSQGDWDASMPINDGIVLTSSRDILEAIASNQGPDKMVISLGYAGWEAGQLEREMTENAWLSTPADTDLIFNSPAEQLWQATSIAMGIDFGLLSSEKGHA